jgi:hypothetical protein
MRIIPISEARTPMKILILNRSMPNMAPKRRVQILLVEVRTVKLATLVYSRQAVTRYFAANQSKQNSSESQVVSRTLRTAFGSFKAFVDILDSCTVSISSSTRSRVSEDSSLGVSS